MTSGGFTKSIGQLSDSDPQSFCIGSTKKSSKPNSPGSAAKSSKHHLENEPHTSLSSDSIPLAFRESRAASIFSGGKLFKSSSTQHADAGDELEEKYIIEEQPKVMLRGWLECRKKRRFAKYNKQWNPKYFLLLSDSLIYMDSMEDRIIRGKYPLLGASASSWNEYKSLLGTNVTEYSNSKTKSISKDSVPQYEPPEERTLVVTTADSQSLYIRYPNRADRDVWLRAIIDVSDRLISRYTPQLLKEAGIRLRILNCAKDSSGELSFSLEGEVSGDIKWQFWRTYEEFCSTHKNVVVKLVSEHASPPEFPEIPKTDNYKDFIAELRTYLSLITHIEAVTQSPEFLAFLGLVSQPQLTSVVGGNLLHTFSVEQMLEMCQTGDLILVSNGHWISQVQRKLTKAEWDHIGMIVNIPTNRQSRESLYIIEATSADGVKLYPLSIRLHRFGDSSVVGYRKLEWNRFKNEQTWRNLQTFIDGIEGKQYSLKGLVLNSSSPDKFFCSQLVAELYKVMGVFPNDANSGSFLPGDYSSASKSLPFVNGCSFEQEEVLITFKELEVAKSTSAKEREVSVSIKESMRSPKSKH